MIKKRDRLRRKAFREKKNTDRKEKRYGAKKRRKRVRSLKRDRTAKGKAFSELKKGRMHCSRENREKGKGRGLARQKKKWQKENQKPCRKNHYERSLEGRFPLTGERRKASEERKKRVPCHHKRGRAGRPEGERRDREKDPEKGNRLSGKGLEKIEGREKGGKKTQRKKEGSSASTWGRGWREKRIFFSAFEKNRTSKKKL